MFFCAAPQLPEFTIHLKNIVAVQGKDATFECEVFASDDTQIHWFKGTRQIYNGMKFKVFKEGFKHVLIVTDVFGEDADEYVCRAVNKAGSRTSRADLTIKSKSPRMS